MKKIVCLMLSICLCAGMAVPALATEIVSSGTCGADADGNNLTWTLDIAGTLTISGVGKMEDYSREEQEPPWFDYLDSITTLDIRRGVTSIGEFAFFDCAVLTNISIPDSVTEIGVWAFSHCSSLTNITFPASVTSIDYPVFTYCYALTDINVDSENPFYMSENGVLFDRSKATLICHPAGKAGEYAIPKGVTVIGGYAFDSCSGLTSITIPDSVVNIGGYAFYDCSNLTTIMIPASVNSIGGSAFARCSNLTAIQVDSANPFYMIKDGVLFNRDQSWTVKS